MLSLMRSLDSVIADHGPVLLIDSASSAVQVGLARPATGWIWRQSTREPGISIFEALAAILADTGMDRRAVGAMVFCEGPGSILGIRTAAMALRIWKGGSASAGTTFAYLGLQLAAHHLAAIGKAAPFAVIADARRDAWHLVEVVEGAAPGALQRWSTAEVAEYRGTLYAPAGFGRWCRLPRPAATLPYSPADWWPRYQAASLVHESNDPDAFLLHAATYAAWTPQIHRAPRRQSA